MIGSTTFRWVQGGWDHIGYKNTNYLALGNEDVDDDTGLIPRGTWVDDYASSDNEMVLASGHALGILTQDVNKDGLSGLQGFRDFTIGKFDRAVAKGTPVSIRRPSMGALMEFEGKGAAVPGNLVCTETTTGLLSSGTAVGTELSTLNGCLRVAQSGDWVVARLVKANLTPVTAGNLRILIEAVSYKL